MAGWIRLHRRIVDSDIYLMPPLYLRVFERLLLEANYQDNEIPYKERGAKVTGKKLIRRGERLTSARDICKWVAWYERGRLKVPNPKTVQEILDWLVLNGMLEIYGEKGNRTETHYKVVNYGLYQSKDEAKVTEQKQLGNSQVTEKQQSLETNKNVKNDKNDKKDIGVASATDLARRVMDEYNRIFGEFWKQPLSLTSGRQKMIRARLKRFTPDDLVKAMENLRQSDFHCGKNDRQTFYAKPDFIFRSDDKIDEWLKKGQPPQANHYGKGVHGPDDRLDDLDLYRLPPTGEG